MSLLGCNLITRKIFISNVRLGMLVCVCFKFNLIVSCILFSLGIKLHIQDALVFIKFGDKARDIRLRLKTGEPGCSLMNGSSYTSTLKGSTVIPYRVSQGGSA